MAEKQTGINPSIQESNGDKIQTDVEISKQPSIAEGQVDEKLAVDTVNAENEYTAQEYRRLLWKIDLWLLPLMWAGLPLSFTFVLIVRKKP